MVLVLRCRELGKDCEFVTEGETEREVIDSLMRHVHAAHSEDWFEIEEIYEAAHVLVQRQAA